MSKVDCSKVYVADSKYSTPDDQFDGAFAAVDIEVGELVERGVMRRLPGLDGMNNQFVFTWSDEIPNNTWAAGSGCAAFYNTGLPGDCNTEMKRFFDEDRFEIWAVKAISKGEELSHSYKSLAWRSVFMPLHDILVSESTTHS